MDPFSPIMPFSHFVFSFILCRIGHCQNKWLALAKPDKIWSTSINNFKGNIVKWLDNLSANRRLRIQLHYKLFFFSHNIHEMSMLIVF